MSYFADVRCPRCGKTKQLHLGGYGFYGHDKESCDYCGFNFDPRENCQSMETDRDCYPQESKNINIKEIKEKRLEDEVKLLQLEVNKLKEELRKSRL